MICLSFSAELFKKLPKKGKRIHNLTAEEILGPPSRWALREEDEKTKLNKEHARSNTHLALSLGIPAL